jgi:hypothetical protein
MTAILIIIKFWSSWIWWILQSSVWLHNVNFAVRVQSVYYYCQPCWWRIVDLSTASFLHIKLSSHHDFPFVTCRKLCFRTNYNRGKCRVIPERKLFHVKSYRRAVLKCLCFWNLIKWNQGKGVFMKQTSDKFKSSIWGKKLLYLFSQFFL